MLGTEQLECVSYGIVCGVLYRVNSEKTPTNKDDRRERESCVQLHKLVADTRPGHVWNVSFPSFSMVLYVYL